MRIKYVFLHSVLCVITVRATPLIQVQNTMQNDAYAAIYDYKEGTWVKSADIQKVPSFGMARFSVKMPALFGEQRLVVALNAKELPDVFDTRQILLSNMEFKTRPYENKKFTVLIQQTDKGLQIKKSRNFFSNISDYGSRLIEKAKDAIRKKTFDITKRTVIRENASVLRGNALNPKEVVCIEKRAEYVRNHLASFLDITEQDVVRVPRIGMICSGGGMRAMISTYGWLEGAQNVGLLDIITYVAGLSGSTWAIGSWLTYKSDNTFKDKTLTEIKDRIFTNITEGFTKLSASQLKDIVDALLVRMAYQQPITIVDIFQYFLANKLFKDFTSDRYSLALSDQYSLVSSGIVPFPLYAAVLGDAQVTRFTNEISAFAVKSTNKPWVEFSPVEVGTAAFNGLYVPTWAFGRSFQAGESSAFTPGITVSKMMATCGSAYAASIEAVWAKAKKTISNPLIKNYLEKIKEKEEGFLDKHGERHIPYAMAEEYNFAYGLDLDNPIFAQKKVIKFKDAGLAFNLPYPLLSGERCPERKMDILIICDASASLVTGKTSELQKVAEYAHAAGLPFPKIPFEKQDQFYNKSITVFQDQENKEAPIVLYMPLCQEQTVMDAIKESDMQYGMLKYFDLSACLATTCSTFNFKWPKKISESVSKLTEYAVVSHKELIKDVIKKYVIAEK